MYSINGNTITMTRGDTMIARVGMTRDGTPYTPEPGDSIRFALKSTLNNRGTAFRETAPLLIKEIPNDTLILQIDPEDTKALPFGNYTYDIELTYANGMVDTFIANSRLILAPEVH